MSILTLLMIHGVVYTVTMIGMTVQPDSLYSYSELKKILKIGRPNAEKIIKTGKIPAMKTGRSYLFFGKDILEYLEVLKQPQQSISRK